MTIVRFHELNLHTPDIHLHAIDRMLASAQARLIPPGAELESSQERAWSAASDPARLIILASTRQKPLAIADLVIGYPSPHMMTISQIAVLRKLQRQRIGSQLVRACAKRAHQRAPTLRYMLAYLLDPHSPATSFWEALGFQAQSDNRYCIPLSELLH